ALSRLTLTPAGMIAYRLKRPRRRGAPQLVLTPLEFLGRLATPIPPPRRHLTRYHGVFAPNAAGRAEIVPPAPPGTNDESSTSFPTPARVPATILARRLDWAALLARVLAIDVLRCSECGGRRRVLAFLTDPAVVAKILVHLGFPTHPPPVAGSCVSARDCLVATVGSGRAMTGTHIAPAPATDQARALTPPTLAFA